MKCVRFCTVVLLFNLVIANQALACGFGAKFNSWLLGSEAQAATLKEHQSELDDVAQACVECHNGVRATHITVKDADSPMQFSSSGMQVNHPVGMNYDYYAAMSTHLYTPSLLLDSSITLVEGMVTCVSCHRLKTAEASHRLSAARWDENHSALADTEACNASGELTVGPRETDLCLACHSM
jgi:hypothetical protein